MIESSELQLPSLVGRSLLPRARPFYLEGAVKRCSPFPKVAESVGYKKVALAVGLAAWPTTHRGLQADFLPTVPLHAAIVFE